MAERFFATLKLERVHRRHYRSRLEVPVDIFQYIEILYNRQWPHSLIDQRSPAQLEADVEVEQL